MFNVTRNMIVIGCLILFTSMLSACTGTGNTFDWRKPVTLDMNPPKGPENYQQGWVDGCKTGVASTNTKLHLAIGSYQFTLDETLRYDELYNKAWRYGFNHCGYSMKSLAQYQL